MLYSWRQASMTTWAPSSVANSSTFSSSSRARPLKDSTNGFSQDEPGSIVGGGGAAHPVPVPQPGMSSGPLSMRRCSGAPRSATRRPRTPRTSLASQLRPDPHGQGLPGVLVGELHSFSLRRSAVSSNWKSRAQTWFGCSARRSSPLGGRVRLALQGGGRRRRSSRHRRQRLRDLRSCAIPGTPEDNWRSATDQRASANLALIISSEALSSVSLGAESGCS